MVKCLLLLLACLTASGQGFSFRDQPFMGNATATVSFAPTDVSGMALYWNYTDLSAGTVSTWTDRIQGVVSSQSGTKRPSKDANGVLFNIANNTSLTNVAPTANGFFSNSTVWIVFKMSTANTSFKALVSDRADSWGLMQGNASNGSMIFYPRSTGTMWTAAANVLYDWVLLRTNDVTKFNQSYTNGVATGTTSSAGDPNKIVVEYIGNDGADEPFDGYIKFIGVWTNKFLTQAQITSLYQYSSTH